MSADRVRITCGLGAWHDGHKDKVLAIAVRESDPLRADALGWRILTGGELKGQLAKTEDKAGPIVSSSDDDCWNCLGYASAFSEFTARYPHSNRCRVIRPVCECGWPGVTVQVIDLVPLLEAASESAAPGIDGYVSMADLYPLATTKNVRNNEKYSPPFMDFRFWNRPDPEEVRRAALEGRSAPAVSYYSHFDLFIMCDGKEGTTSRTWHRRHGSSRALMIRYAADTHTAALKDLRWLGNMPLADESKRQEILPRNPNLTPRECDRACAEELIPLLQPVFDSGSPHERTLWIGPELNREQHYQFSDFENIENIENMVTAMSKDMATTIRPCLCGRTDMPVWFGMFTNPRPFTAMINNGTRVLSVEGFKRLLALIGELA